MEDKTKVQLGALVGASAFLIGVACLWKKNRETEETKVKDRTVLDEKQKEKATEMCPCGAEVPVGTSCIDGSKPLYDSTLLGTVGLYDKHVIICSGCNGDVWSRKVLAEKGSFAPKLKKAVLSRKKDLRGRVKLSVSDEPTRSLGELETTVQEKADLIVFPDKIRYLDVTEEQCQYIVEDHFINGEVSDRVQHEEVEEDFFILVCCHANKDMRCGTLGPQVLAAFQEVIQQRGAQHKIAVRQTSHLGGHKYAGVVIVYPTGDWYGMVTRDNIEKIVDAYLSEDATIPYELWRGRMGLGKNETKNLEGEKRDLHSDAIEKNKALLQK
eukprot:CAMPEP_0174251122 /NCGR_PEP_ID=MMETSP0439-20130205/1055_1 /TAXON_ID=0 /ORGANISM="Stereomyxa ramosa, Strain Chinc5" /LENGTH=325 /DNA_ID=CAMNT_0015331363 /DNA_START=18 /DNA_END=995 /DNA_ORIENTATION=+